MRESLRERWEFGKLMLTERVNQKGEPAKRLPDNRLAELVKATGKSQAELNYRMQFVEAYPTDDELLTAVRSFMSWRQLRQSLANPGQKSECERWKPPTRPTRS